MRWLSGGVLAAALCFAPAAMAGGYGPYKHPYRHHHYDHPRHHVHPHHHWHQPPAWGYWKRHDFPPRRVRKEVHHYYYAQPSPFLSPGLHVIFPDVYIPWPQPR